MGYTSNLVFSEEQYRTIAETAAKYWRETAKADAIPLIKAKQDDFKYRHRKFGDGFSGFGTHEYTDDGRRARVKHLFDDFYLESYQMILQIPKENIKNYNIDNTLAEARREEIAKAMYDIDNAIFHGVVDVNENVPLNEGLLDRGDETVEDLSSTSDEDLSSKGEIYTAINNLIDEIPFRYRESLPMVLMVSEGIDAEVRRPDRIYQDKVEFDFIYENLIGPKASPARKIDKYIVTDKILAEAYDDTAGVNADSEDTKGTHDRMLLFVPDARLVARVVSRPFSLTGEELHMHTIDQSWGWRGAGCVFDENAIKYTEALTV